MSAVPTSDAMRKRWPTSTLPPPTPNSSRRSLRVARAPLLSILGLPVVLPSPMSARMLTHPFSDVQNSFGWLGSQWRRARGAVPRHDSGCIGFASLATAHPVGVGGHGDGARSNACRCRSPAAAHSRRSGLRRAGPAAGGGIPARVRVGVRRQLDRPLLRHSAAIGHAFGLLLGVSFPVGLLIMTSALHPGFGSPDQLAWFGAVGWLAFLALPHVLARPGLQQTSIVQLQ